MPQPSSPTIPDMPDMIPNETDRLQVEAAVFRRLLQHLLQERPDVQNIDLMITAGFCRNCLADWYREAADACGAALTTDQAREAIYGTPFAQWKAQYQRAATPEQLAVFAAASQAKHPPIRQERADDPPGEMPEVR